MLGYFWEDGCYYCGSDDSYMSDTEFMDWYAGVSDLLGESLGNNALETFEDGHKYSVSAFAKVSNFSAPMGTEGEVTIVICILVLTLILPQAPAESIPAPHGGCGFCFLMS